MKRQELYKLANMSTEDFLFLKSYIKYVQNMDSLLANESRMEPDTAYGIMFASDRILELTLQRFGLELT